MKFTADCPQCSTEFEISGIAAARSGLTCPSCAVQFVPESVHREQGGDKKNQATEMIKNPVYENPEYVSLRAKAETVFVIGLICSGGSVLILFGAPMDEGGKIYLSAGVLSLGFVLLLFSQLLHIRASLERLRK